jgi:copper transport protein
VRIPIRRTLTLIGALLCAALLVTPAYAHALLIRSNPAANAVLAEAPAQVELFFSESVEAGLSSITVLDSTGKAVDLGDARVDGSNPTRMTVSLGSLQDGVYTVSWKAISATDGHLTNGSFPFAIGNGNAATLAAQTQKTSSELPASALISKWLLLAALALLVGRFSFTELVWKPAFKSAGTESSGEDYEPGSWKRLVEFALLGLFVALGLSILSEAGQAAGHELALPWAPESGRVLLGSRIGVIWLARLGLAFIEVWLLTSRSSSWKRWAAFATGLALLLSVSLTAHAATEARPLLPIISDWLHMIGMCFWLGGLAYLLSGLRELRKLDDILRTRLTSLTVERFSLMALISVGVIGVTGLYAAWLRVGTVQALYTSIYGDALLLKQVFVAALLALAAINLLYISPRLKKRRLQGAGDIPLVTHFRQMVIAEVALGCLLLMSVSLLTYLPPARIIPPSFDLDGSALAGDLSVTIKVSPGTVGQNTFTVHLTSGGKPVQAVKEALLRFTPGQSNVPPSEAQLLAVGNGDYSVKGSFLSLPGNWQVQVVVRRENKFDDFANFNFSIILPGANRENAATSNIAGGVLVLDAVLFAIAMLSMPGNLPARAGTSAILGVLLAAGGLFYATRPVSTVNAQANPIVPDAKSVAAGQAIYEAHCVVCHGATGKGDGPLGLTLIPRPADLTIHAVPGVHTDGQLYDWITNGFPGSAMPAWRDGLSDTDRWNLVNLIRTMAPKAQP